MSARSIRDRLREQFVLHVDQTAVAIAHRMLEYEAVLRSGVALFKASELVTRSDFRRFCDHLELSRYYRGFQGVAFAKHVRRGELEGFVDEVRAEGFTNFHVHPAGERETYMPILYIEPLNRRNQRAFGYDMFSEPNRRAAMLRAWETDAPAATPILQLIQDRDEARPTNGFLLYLPLFTGATGPVRDRRSSLQGFVYAAFRVEDLLPGILGTGPTDRDIALYDGDSTSAFYDTREPGTKYEQPEYEYTRLLTVGGQPWRLRAWSRPSFASWVSRSEPLRLLVAGAVINLLLFYILGASASLQRRAQQMASGMTEQLQASHAREQARMRSALREKEALLREIHHRVKNNLQVISSLLSLQRSSALEGSAAEALRQSQHRVLAMAAVHEFLCQSEDMARVDARAYLTHVVGVVSAAYQTSGRIALELEIGDVALDLDQAVSCGLITNELVSNAFKYAFSERNQGTLRVRLKLTESRQVQLEVSDDGPSLPADVSVAAPTTLGLQLVDLLTQQLGGRLSVASEQGASFRVTFPESKGVAA